MFNARITDTEINIENVINTLLTDSKENAYNLSVVVLASAQYADKEKYTKSLPILLSVLKKMEDNSFKSWMLGRVVLAAKLTKDNETLALCLPDLKKLLSSVKKDKLSTWAWGYLAALDADEYKSASKHMLDASAFLTVEYLKSKQKTTDAKSDDDAVVLSDVLWSHVMNAQAAALANDNETFDAILSDMKKVTGKSSVIDALSQIPESDWQAWAIGIVKLAASTIRNESINEQLSRPLRESILAARKANSDANAVLAYLCELEAKGLLRRHVVGMTKSY